MSAFSSRGGRDEKLLCEFRRGFTIFIKIDLIFIVAFKVYDMDRDGFISNGELFLVLKMMVGNNLKDGQLQQIVDKTIMEADKDGDGKLSFEEFVQMVSNTVRAQIYLRQALADVYITPHRHQDIVKQMTLEDLF